VTGQTFAVGGEALLTALMDPAARPQAATDPPLPDYVADFLVRLRLGHGIPFNYVVPDPAFLPDGSIRFFTVDEAWLDAILTGVLAVGSASTRDTDHTDAVLPAIRAAVRDARPLAAAVRRRQLTRSHLITHLRAAVARADELPDPGGTPPVTGFLLRSALVSGWPGMSVRAFTTDVGDQVDPSQVDPSLVVPILRLELLAPSILLVLFAGSPALVWLEEPHHGIQLGVDPGTAAGTYQVVLVGPTGTDVTTTDPHGQTVPKTAAVPTRGGPVPGVVDVAALQGALAAEHAADNRVAPQGGSAALALQLLRPPVRQRFSAAENPQ
jgi:hypothetical protein